MRARFLEEENNGLKAEVDEMKRENGDLRERLQVMEGKIADFMASRK